MKPLRKDGYAGITIAENATLYINSSDTSWLKVIADGETAYPYSHKCRKYRRDFTTL